jgi:hypothetical protein
LLNRIVCVNFCSPSKHSCILLTLPRTNHGHLAKPNHDQTSLCQFPEFSNTLARAMKHRQQLIRASVSASLNFRTDCSMMKKVDITASLGVLQVLLHVLQRDLHPNSHEYPQYLQARQFFWRKANRNGQSIKEKDPCWRKSEEKSILYSVILTE